MNKRFEVTITEIGEEVRTIGHQWENGAGENGEGYGYTPEIQATRPYERTVFRQSLEALDLAVLVRTINPEQPQ